MGLTLRKTFWNTFDHLGTCVLLNLAWFALTLPWFIGAFFAFRVLSVWLGAVGFVTALLASVVAVWLSPPSLAVLAISAKWAEYRSPDRTDMLRMLAARLWNGFWLSVAGFAVVVVLGVNSAFYLRLEHMPRWIGLILGGIMLWAQVALLMVAFHLALNQARHQTATARQSLRQAAFLVLQFPLQTVALGGACFVLAGAFAITQVGLPLAAMTIPSVLAATGERELLKRLAEPGSGDTEHSHLEEVRTLRDLIRPWDMGR